MQSYPRSRGILFDQETVVEGARGRIAALGLGSRIEIATGDFFKRVPEDGDAYVLKYIIHGWDDERSVTILRNVGRVMRKDGKLLLEGVVPESNEPSFSKLGDLHKLVMTGGRAHGRRIPPVARPGFKLERIVPSESLVSVLEAVQKTR